ncbi:hypothetical protein [Spirulina major]|uniref:hypothetical protein n=1 Tax=Spirulina major TaxID=270636 RepID=UPI000934C294|nr:hypothetical protein [Spirulina major]
MRLLILRLIKILSTLLILSALGLEAWHLYAAVVGMAVPAGLTPIFWLERFAIAAHLVESGIAIALSPSRGQHPIPAALYTFFTGFVGLIELRDRPRLTD